MAAKLALIVAVSAILAYFGHKRWEHTQMLERLEAYRHTKGDGAQKLKAQTTEFSEPQVVKVTEGIYMAIGFGLANSILIDGPEGSIIIDTMESMAAAEKAYAALKKVSKKPVKAIIYTHNHADHVSGAQAFLADNIGRNVEIWSHVTLMDHVLHNIAVTNTAYFKRSMRQFGALLPKSEMENAGIGIRLEVTPKRLNGFIAPNRFLTGEAQDVTIAGLKLRLVHIPGETDDQIGVWYPEKKAFFCADDVYKTFPNLYAIRGTPFRSLLKWIKSVDIMRALRPEFLIPSHTLHLEGADEIHETLTIYRDGIQFVHDQTVRYINLGLHPDEIAAKIVLPERLRNHRFLQQFYGTVGWSSKGLFNGYMGWFSGDPVDLTPLPPAVRAERLVKLGGGAEKVLKVASESLENNDLQWALELASAVLKIAPTSVEAKEIMSKALIDLARSQTSANGFNYYMTSAYEVMGKISLKPSPEIRAHAVHSVPSHVLFKMLAIRFRGEDLSCTQLDKKVMFNFTDTSQTVGFHVRNGILEIQTDLSRENAEVYVRTTEKVWRELLGGERSRLLTSLLSSDFEVEGGAMKLKEVMDCIDSEV